MEANADVLTALAMFPFKSNDKKVCFVLGLALLFKIPFDVSFLYSVRSLDFTDWFTVITQSVLCLALMNHYGMLRALFNKPMEFDKLPPPPSS